MLLKTLFICSQEKRFHIERKSFLFSTTSTLTLHIVLYFNYQLVVIKFQVECFDFCVFLSFVNSDHFLYIKDNLKKTRCSNKILRLYVVHFNSKHINCRNLTLVTITYFIIF